ncbi:MAG: DUF1990 family protein [Rubrobacteraceae bacterium]
MTEQKQPRDATYWARQTGPLRIEEVPRGASALNVQGRRVVGPVQGFGKMWHKTYKVRLEGADVSPEEVVETWRDKFPEFMPYPEGFRVPRGGLVPGAVVLLGNFTGVMVLYADDVSFTYMSPEGHPFSGWITFSSHRDENGVTVAQVQALIRANDPLYELTMPLLWHKVEDITWQPALRNLAAHFGVRGEVESKRVCVDRKRQWRNYKNIRDNAIIRYVLHAIAAPFRGRRN